MHNYTIYICICNFSIENELILFSVLFVFWRETGLVFLQYRSETKRALLPNEITSIDTVKALFVRSFPKQLTMEYMESPHVKIYIHDSSKDMFYELEDLRYYNNLVVLCIFCRFYFEL